MLAARSFVGSWCSQDCAAAGLTTMHTSKKPNSSFLIASASYVYGPYVKRYVLLFGLVRAATRYHLYVTPPTWRVDVISPNDEIEFRRMFRTSTIGGAYVGTPKNSHANVSDPV